MKFTIITPTLQRPSLLATCDSVDVQSYPDWQHIVIVDCETLDLPRIAHPNRLILQCEHPHRNGGNTCRRKALESATGDYVIFLDDDNFLADANVLSSIKESLELAGCPLWAVFPIIRLGGHFFSDPPQNCHIDTLNLVFHRSIAFWPETDAYGTDGIVVDTLKERGIPWVAFPDHRPIGIIPTISFCK